MKLRTEYPFAIEVFIGLLVSVLAGVFSAMALILVVMMLPGVSHAETGQVATPAQGLMRKADAGTGMVLFRTQKQGYYQPAPRLKTDVHIRVSGMIARAKVVQRFKNPGAQWAEGIYVFPLPETAAVDHMTLRIGNRLIEGVIREKQEAKKIYQAAKKAGKKTSLLEQERANLFTTSLANIAPGEEIAVEIEYQQSVVFENGRFQLRFPLVVAPRYIPGQPQQVNDNVKQFSGSGWARDTDQVNDASRITPPVQLDNDGDEQPLNPVSIIVRLNAGLPLADINSAYHRVDTSSHSDGSVTIRLSDEAVPADRDFSLSWRPDAGELPKAALFTESDEQGHYLMLMVMPPELRRAEQQVINREVIYVIDTSGSMGGQSIRQARNALSYAVEKLRPGDYFNIIQFNSSTSQLFGRAVPIDAQTRQRAKDYIHSLKAGGGTEMADALHAGLQPARDPQLVRQVVFLTDGSVGNEQALFDIIQQKLGDSRLFTVGIGSAPNSHFMSRAASIGRGAFTYIGKLDEVEKRMAELFEKIEMPVMTDIKLEWPQDATTEVYPQQVPDLFAGQPLMIVARTDQMQGHVTVRGQRAQQSWQASIALSGKAPSPGVNVIWARKKIADLMQRLSAGLGKDVVKRAVTDIALRYHLVSRYTSLVAVDKTPSRPVADPLNKKAMPVNLPHGWDASKVFGGLPQTATDSFGKLVMGLLLIGLACLLSVYFRWRTYHAA